MSRVLVTGASGFIGKPLVPRLRAEGHDVVAAARASGDVAHETTWARFPSVDVVVHLAGRSFVPDSWNSPGEFLRSNLLGTIGALEFCRARSARLVFPSSYLYGHAAPRPVAETAALTASNPYALSKKLGEDACQFFAERLGVRITVLRLFNVYGPGQSGAFLVPTIVRQVQDGREVTVKDLEPRRDYVYVLDVVDAIAKSVARSQEFTIFNVGSGASHSVAELVRLIQDVWGTDLPVRSDGVSRKDELMDTVADIRRAEQQLGWKPRFTLREGIESLRSVS